MSELAWKRKSGEPQILRGVRCVGCGQPADEQHLCLMKLNKPQACGLCLQATGKWTGPAYWLVSHTSACDACIRAMADMNSDNEQWLMPALADISTRAMERLYDAVQAKLDVEENLATFFAGVTSWVESTQTPLFYEHDGEDGWFPDPAIPPDWGIEVRSHNEFYAYIAVDHVVMDYIPDQQGFDQIYDTYEDALAAIVAAERR